MIIELHPTACYGKATSGSEYGMIRAGAGLPSEIAAAAASWMEAFLSVSQRTMAALHRADDGRWWLIRAEDEVTPDGAGRRRAFLVLGGLPSEPDPDDVPSLLVNLARLPVSKAAPPAAIDSGGKTEPTASPESAAAALALALGDAQVSVSSPGAFASALRAVGLGRCRWIALFPRSAPGRLPEGDGLVYTGESLPIPTDVRQIVTTAGQAAVLSLPLSGLAAASPTRTGRLDLIQSALAGGTQAGLSADAVSWLLTTPAGRDAALARLDRSAVGDWLKGADARAEDLAALQGRLTPAHWEAGLALALKHSDPFRVYARAFPDDSVGMIRALPGRLQVAWRWLVEGGTPPAAATVDELFETIAGTSLEASLEPKWLARASASGSRIGARRFTDYLASRLLPEALAAALTGWGPGLRSAPRSLPPSGLGAEGLVELGVVPDRWLALEEPLASDLRWQTWWVDGVEALHGAGAIAPEPLAEIGLRRNLARLLRRVNMPPGLIALADPAGGRVRMPASRWPAAAWKLLARLFREDALLDRIDGELNDELVDWLSRSGDEEMFGWFRRLLGAFRQGERVPPKTLEKAARRASRDDVLRQIAAWAGQPAGPERSDAIRALLDSDRLSSDERNWLDVRTLRCSPIPPAPAWSSRDLLALFKMLNPVDDVVRVVLARPSRSDGEEELLGQVVEALRDRPSPSPSPGTFPASARNVRPDWVRALAGLPGWDGCASHDERLRLIRDLCRSLADAGVGEIPASMLPSIQTLARGTPGEDAR